MIRLFHQYVSAKGVALCIVESGLTLMSLEWAVRIRFWDNPPDAQAFLGSPWFLWQTVARLIVLQVCFYYGDLYAPRTLANRNEQVISLGKSLGSGCFVLGVMYFLFPDLLVGRGIFVISTVLLAASVLALRTAVNAAWKAAESGQRTIVLGTGGLAAEVACGLNERDDLGARIVGFLGETPDSRGTKVAPGYPVLGLTAEVDSIVRKHGVTRLIVAVENRRGVLPITQLLRLRFEGLRIEDGHDTLAALSGRVSLRTIKPSWFIFSEGFHRSGPIMALKRFSDLIIAVAGLIITLPLMALLAAVVWLDSGRPILYRQARVGLRGRVFHLLKFRSMRQDAEKAGAPQWAAAGDSRVTRIGKYLRKFRLDELPQFLNIIRGEMSFIGPRPERPEFVARLRDAIAYYDERHLVRPGLTGWAQVQYTYGSSEEDAYRKLEYDLFYLKNMSAPLDMLILAKTVRIVFTGQGAR